MRFSALLLAGGKSSRMGRDKALLEIEGEPLWRRQLATLRQLSPARLMIAGPAFAGCDCQILRDEIPNAGPLAGVAAGLRHCTTSHLIVLAIDLPEMTADFFRALLADCGEGEGIVPRAATVFEPLAAIYPVRAATLAASCLRAGEFSMQNFVRRALAENLIRPREIAPNELALFTNLNTPADYERFRAREIHPSR